MNKLRLFLGFLDDLLFMIFKLTYHVNIVIIFDNLIKNFDRLIFLTIDFDITGILNILAPSQDFSPLAKLTPPPHRLSRCES